MFKVAWRSMAGVCLAALLGGCGDPLKDAQRIEESRVLAVQIEGPGGTATPSAGEDATVRFLLAGPDGPEPAQVAYRVCEAADSARGVPYCVGDTLAEGVLRAGSSVPELDFTLPLDATPESRLAVLGVVCVKGDPSLGIDPEDFTCSGGNRPLRLSFDAYVGGSERNRNPDLSQLSVVISGQAVSLSDPDAHPSCDEGTVMVGAGESHQVVVSLGSESREDDEWLQVSHFATRGKFERQYTVIEPGESASATLDWKAPDVGVASAHYLVVRDGLGGVAFATWHVCAE